MSLLELKFGKVLGVGSFGIVCEITHITLLDGDPTMQSIIENATEFFSESFGFIDEDAQDDYDLDMARKKVATHCIRQGEARYAVKCVRGDLDEVLEARARIDLAIEVRFLHALSHPNIVKMRGIFQTDDPFHQDYFLIMDRLSGTLKERIMEWKRMTTENKKPISLLRNFVNSQYWNGAFSRELMIERLCIAYDIASAFRHLHSKKLVYRDIKPENIGFDIRGTAKVFDFGFTKMLHPELRNSQGMYHLTSCTGSFPYMAPEVASMEPYNEKCDVFSFGILIWEIIALQPACVVICKSSFLKSQSVAKNQMRLPVSRKWPILTKQAMQSSWNHNAEQRPSMATIRRMLRVDVELLTEQNFLRDRTLNMMDESNRSMQASAQLKSCS